MKNRTQTGFTIYELLITLLIVGIIMTIGLPSLSDFTRNSRISSATNDLHSAFLLARSEAPRAKQNVTICATKDPREASPKCEGDEWHLGWLVFVDADGDLEIDNSADEPILRRFPALNEAIEIAEGDGARYFSFGPSGLGRGDVDGKKSAKTFTICDDRGNIKGPGGWSTARYMVITPIGRSTILRDVNVIDARGGCP